MIKEMLICCGIVIISACSTPPKKEPKPDVLIHEDKGPIFWYQVYQREDGIRYIKEVYRNTITVWD